MKRFSEFYINLEKTNETSEYIEIIKDYFLQTNDNDKLWVLYLFYRGRIKNKFGISQLKQWAIEYSHIPEWLFDESYASVGDLAETISLILPDNILDNEKNLSDWIHYIESSNLSVSKNKELVIDAWNCLDNNKRYIFNKFITGSFRRGIPKRAFINAIAEIESMDKNDVACRLSGKWHPDRITYNELLHGFNISTKISKPYPFYFARNISEEAVDLGSPDEWTAEWKCEGIRVQLIYRNGELFIWTRDGELLTEKFPEFERDKVFFPDNIVLDGEIVCYTDSKPLFFNLLQRRIGRENITSKILKESPVVFIIYDILEDAGKDIRLMQLNERKKIISNYFSQNINSICFKISAEINFSDWDQLREIRKGSRNNFTEGIMLKRKSSAYSSGVSKADWWKWKNDPYTIDAVLVYAQKGQGEKSDLYSDYSFAVWDKNELVTITRTYSGLTDKEITEIDAFVKNNILEKFGPVRTVKAELVFELSFEGIALSGRHKSGVNLKLPRILRWRKEKKIEEADNLESLIKLVK